LHALALFFLSIDLLYLGFALKLLEAQLKVLLLSLLQLLLDDCGLLLRFLLSLLEQKLHQFVVCRKVLSELPLMEGDLAILLDF